MVAVLICMIDWAVQKISVLGILNTSGSPPTLSGLQEFCNGGSLRDAVAKGYFTVESMPRRWGPIMRVLTDIVEGMRHMHGKRICHGDLNPANVMFKVCTC